MSDGHILRNLFSIKVSIYHESHFKLASVQKQHRDVHNEFTAQIYLFYEMYCYYFILLANWCNIKLDAVPIKTHPDNDGAITN